jgi:hypothetical protein
MTGKEPKSGPNIMVELATGLDEESDRALAILAAAYLDHLLRRWITLRLELDDLPEAAQFLFEGFNAGLATFSSRIQMAKHLDLLSEEEQRDLTLIKAVRNEFAHEFTGISFETQSISDRCRELAAAKVSGQPPTPRECYQKACVRLMGDILLQIRSLEGGDRPDDKGA